MRLLPPRDAVLVVSVQDYLHRPLIDLARLMYGPDTPIIAMRAWRNIDKKFLARLFLFDLPFRVRRIFTPSDLGGRLVRVLLDYARLLGIECCVVPAHNHPVHLDAPLPWPLRYVDLSRPRVIGGFARGAKLITNDASMEQFFLSLGYASHRLERVDDWIGRLYRRPQPVTHPLVFFTEVMQEIDAAQCETNLARVVRLAESGLVPRICVKLHPREPQEAVEMYRDRLGRYACVELIDMQTSSLDVINQAGLVMASFSTVLLEALWLGKRVVVLDNPTVGQTMLARYLRDDNHLRFDDGLDVREIGRWCEIAMGECAPLTGPSGGLLGAPLAQDPGGA